MNQFKLTITNDQEDYDLYFDINETPIAKKWQMEIEKNHEFSASLFREKVRTSGEKTRIGQPENAHLGIFYVCLHPIRFRFRRAVFQKQYLVTWARQIQQGTKALFQKAQAAEARNQDGISGNIGGR